jgi:hypothetical protein
MADDESQPDGIIGRAARVYVETREERERPLREQLGRMASTFGSTDNMVLGVVLNLATIVVGVGIYLGTSGLLSYAGTVVGILGVLGILSGVLRL